MSENGFKAPTQSFDIAVADARSVIEPPPKAYPLPASGPDQLFWFVQNYANEITPWGAMHKLRDRQLRAFIPQENIFASALGIICSRNSGFSWKLDGPPRTVSYFQDLLENANNGRGWHDLIVKTTIDLSTQDNGAFWELPRQNNNRADSMVVGINHLDSARCWNTGMWETPVVYQDWKGQFHLLNWWNVIHFTDMPSTIEQLGYYDLQYSSLTRLLQKMQTIRNIDIYDYEKTGGRNSKAIHLVKGITTQQLQDAINKTKAASDSRGMMRYADPVLVGTISPEADVGHDTINMVDVPDGYSPDVAFGQYINLISMAFMTDYQEFAPLPGQRLGTGAQSEVLHLKARGKGPGTFMSMITRALNFKVIPKNARFLFDEQDLEAEKTMAEVKSLRAQRRSVMIQSGEITPEVSRQIANDEGDLELEFIKLMGEQDITPGITVGNEDPADVANRTVVPGQPGPSAAPGKSPGAGETNPVRNTATRGTNRRAPIISPPTPLGPKLR